MLQSSTPDGLAPIDNTTLIVFTCTIGGLSMIWGIVNLVLLIKFSPDSEMTQKMERVFEVSRKLLRGTVDVVKMNLVVGFIAAIIFFFIIMGAIEHFNSFYYSLAFLFGFINSIIIIAVSAMVTCLAKTKIITCARFSLSDAYDAAKRAANLLTYLVLGEVVFVIGIFMIVYERQNRELVKSEDEMIKIAKSLVYFSFGSATVAIGSRIINSIYGRASELSVQTLQTFGNQLEKNYKHPALLSKVLGEILNKSISTILDSCVYLSSGISVSVYAAAYNIIGTDQQGQIVFEFSYSNCYLPILSFLFSLFFNLLLNVVIGFVLHPSTGDAIRTVFTIQRYGTVFFLVGFQALAAYLCLPAEFFVDQLGEYGRKPYHAYLSILFGLLVGTFVSTVAQIFSTHPFFVNSLSSSCKTGSATNVIYGLSFGYFFTCVPIIFIAGTLFLVDYWLGVFGIGLAVLGYLSLLPNYLNASLVYSFTENASFVSYICNLDETLVSSLVDASKTKKDFEPHVHAFQHGLICYFGFQLVLVFIKSADFEGIASLKDPAVFLGLLVGAMFPYFFNSVLLRSIFKTAPAIIFDLSQQIYEIPAIATGNLDPDFVRTSGLFAFQCLLSIKRFVPVIFGPMILIGIAGGPSVSIGFLCGTVISGIQIGLSSGMSGCGWANIKKQIGLANLRDDEGNPIKQDSDWSRAADVGNSVGLALKQSISLSLPLIIAFWGLQSFAFASMYSNIHS